MSSIKRKLKKCKHDGHMAYLFSHGYCEYHWKVLNLKEKEQNNKISKREYNDFCRDLWDNRPHVSDLSGAALPEYEPHSPKFCNLIRYHLHHVKPIGKEGKSKKELDIVLDADKIIFVTYDEHQIIEFGSDRQKEEIGWFQFRNNFGK